METATRIEFRWLNEAEMEAAAPSFKARGWIPLNPKLGQVVAAFDGDKMIGFACFQCIPHVEPLFVDISYRGTGLAEELVKRMVDFLNVVQVPAAYVVCDNPASERLAQLHGMERVTSPVYRKIT